MPKRILRKGNTQTIEKDENDEVASSAIYLPTVTMTKTTQIVYRALGEMIDSRNESYPEFHDKTLINYLDDGNKRLNAYTLPNEAHDPPKEDWQSNTASTIIRDSMKRTLATFSLEVPEMDLKAYGEDQKMDVDRADTAKWLIVGSYMQDENPILDNFWESWECASQGTVIKYEGYLKTKFKKKKIKSYDAVTGKIEFTEFEVDVDDKCVSYLMPLTEVYIRNFYLNEIQLQPDLCWVRYYDEDTFKYEFGQYPNYTYVKTSAQVTDAEVDTFYYKSKYNWASRSKNNQIEVVRYYKKLTDTYIIVANGVLLLDAPLLWEFNGHKVYPFAKSQWEPFVNKNFFYGKSFPDAMASKTDDYEITRNNMLDKQWRSMKPGLLVGRINTDTFNLEDEFITSTTQIPVEDVDQVKPVPVEGITQGDVQMLQMIAKEIADSAPALPDLLTKKNSTAREVVLAEEHIQQMRNVYNEMITDLWRQKYMLRLSNIQLNYPNPRTIEENGKVNKMYRTFIIDDAELDRTTGERGILAIQFRNFKLKDKVKIQREVSVEEEMMNQAGIKFKKLIVPQDYLDNYRITVRVAAKSLVKESMGRKQAEVIEKIGTIAKIFPQIFVLNQADYFSQFSGSYDDPPAKYLKKLDDFKKQQAAAEKEKQAQESEQAMTEEEDAMVEEQAPEVEEEMGSV